MRDGVTLKRRLSLAGHKPSVGPGNVWCLCSYKWSCSKKCIAHCHKPDDLSWYLHYSDVILFHHLSNTTIWLFQYIDGIMSTVASQITSLTIVYSTVHSGADQRKHQSSASLAFVRGIHQWPVNFPHKGPVTRKMFPFYGVIVYSTPPSGWQQRKHQRSALLGAVSIRKTVLPGMAIPMLTIRRPNGRLIFNMEITIRR